MTTGSARELPHRLDRFAAPQGEGQAAQTTWGDREWKERAKGGQPEKEVSGGWGGEGFANVDTGITTVGGPLAVVGPVPAIHCSVFWSGAVVGVTGAVEELAGVYVALEPVVCVWCSFHCLCVWNA